MPPRIAKHPRAYAALVLVAAAALIYVTGFAYSRIRLLTHGAEIARSPVGIGLRLNRISFVQAEAQAAGVRGGDILVEVEGRPATGGRVLDEAVDQRKPGDPLRLTVQQLPAILTLRLMATDG